MAESGKTESKDIFYNMPKLKMIYFLPYSRKQNLQNVSS